jgi:hypothetical protein
MIPGFLGSVAVEPRFIQIYEETSNPAQTPA